MLVIELPQQYPDVPAEVRLQSPRGLAEDVLKRLEIDIAALATARIGVPMLYEIIEYVKDDLTDQNIPHGECSICLELFEEADVFTKTECYHHFHQYCLGRYVEHSLAEQKIAQREKSTATALAESTKPCVLCPVCRVEITFNLPLLKSAPPPVSSLEKVSFEPSPEVVELQQQMAALFQQQKKRGAIINVEEERNKFLLDPNWVLPPAAEHANSADYSHPPVASVQQKGVFNSRRTTQHHPSSSQRSRSGRFRGRDRAGGRNRGNRDDKSGEYGGNRHVNSDYSAAWKARGGHGEKSRRHRCGERRPGDTDRTTNYPSDRDATGRNQHEPPGHQDGYAEKPRIEDRSTGNRGGSAKAAASVGSAARNTPARNVAEGRRSAGVSSRDGSDRRRDERRRENVNELSHTHADDRNTHSADCHRPVHDGATAARHDGATAARHDGATSARHDGATAARRHREQVSVAGGERARASDSSSGLSKERRGDEHTRRGRGRGGAKRSGQSSERKHLDHHHEEEPKKASQTKNSREPRAAAAAEILRNDTGSVRHSDAAAAKVTRAPPGFEKLFSDKKALPNAASIKPPPGFGLSS
ncbi:PREDICTED: E3 ubiquitin-protein ligase RNF25-like [Priapulus caudatus]|uniref:E3 ubiquitin-protein ligase RNF25-like n=1 Tax=Priapulus caudatus TaxID=37621 RepID=A0ABM1E8B2_PRICU|nr:PREDICTED: E3 ubiquitin-protein ligase RNF25-like [Priapulus caudatus]